MVRRVGWRARSCTGSWQGPTHTGRPAGRAEALASRAHAAQISSDGSSVQGACYSLSIDTMQCSTWEVAAARRGFAIAAPPPPPPPLGCSPVVRRECMYCQQRVRFGQTPFHGRLAAASLEEQAEGILVLAQAGDRVLGLGPLVTNHVPTKSTLQINPAWAQSRWHSSEFVQILFPFIGEIRALHPRVAPCRTSCR